MPFYFVEEFVKISLYIVWFVFCSDLLVKIILRNLKTFCLFDGLCKTYYLRRDIRGIHNCTDLSFIYILSVSFKIPSSVC